MMSDRNAYLNVAKWFLYVGLQNVRSLDVYPLQGSKPIRTFPGTLGPVTIALDPWSDVYTTDNLLSGGLITAYTPGARSVLFKSAIIAAALHSMLRVISTPVATGPCACMQRAVRNSSVPYARAE